MQARRINQLNHAFLWSVTLFTIIAFSLLILQLFSQGVEHWHSGFLTEMPIDGGRSGGILPVILSTLLILCCCAAFVLPLGIGSSIYLYLHNTQAQTVKFFHICLDLLNAIPSIVYGLLGATVFCDLLGLGYSILSGGLTLACMILPLMIRLCDQSLKAMPTTWKQTSYILGLSQWRFLFQIALPRLIPQWSGIFMLCLGRALAETAALLFTSGYVLRQPESIFDSGRSLSVHIYELSMNLPGGDGPAAASAMFLFLFLTITTLSAQSLTRKWSHF